MNATAAHQDAQTGSAEADPLMARACPACDARQPVAMPRFDRDGWRVARCGACDFVYLTNPPAFEALEEDYAWEVTEVKETERRKKATPLVHALDQLTYARRSMFRRDEMKQYLAWFADPHGAWTRGEGDAGHVLDIGCADALRVRAPFVPYGIEISKALAARADKAFREMGGYCVRAAAVEGIFQFPENHFDGIVMRSYLEHEAEPVAVLEGAHRALKPTGKVYVKVPNYGSVNRRVMRQNWCGFRHPDHVNYFTLSSLKAMAAKLGFEARLLNPINLIFDDNIHVLLTRAQTR